MTVRTKAQIISEIQRDAELYRLIWMDETQKQNTHNAREAKGAYCALSDILKFVFS